MKYTTPISYAEVDGGGYVSISKGEFAKLLTKVDEIRAERDLLVAALRQQSRRVEELVGLLVESNRKEPPVVREPFHSPMLSKKWVVE